MGLLSELNLDSVPDLGPVEAGEYELRILKAEDYVGQTSGKQSIRVILSVENEPNADNIFHYLSIPNDDDEEKSSVSKKRRIKEFLSTFNLSDDDSVDGEYINWVGSVSWAIVGQEPDNEGRMRNTIRRWVSCR